LANISARSPPGDRAVLQIHDLGVGLAPAEIGAGRGRLQRHLAPGHGRFQFRQAGEQPARGQTGEAADVDRLHPAVAQLAAGVGDQVEGAAHLGGEADSLAGQGQAAPRLGDQLDADRLLQVLDVARHHRVRHRQLVGGRAHGAQPGEDVEGAKGEKRGEAARHAGLGHRGWRERDWG
jgi:hypothetical protein